MEGYLYDHSKRLYYKTRSDCHDATITQKMLLQKNKKQRILTHAEFEKLRGAEQSHGNYLNIPGVIFRYYCDECEMQCKDITVIAHKA